MSIAEGDLLNLSDEIDRTLLAGADVIHLDVLNDQGRSVEFRPSFVNVIREHAKKSIVSVELGAVIDKSNIKALAEESVDYISFSPAVVDDISSAAKMIKDCGCKAGLSFDFEGDMEKYSTFFDQFDFVNISLCKAEANDGNLSGKDLAKVSFAKNIIDKVHGDLSIWVAGEITSKNISVLLELGVTGFIIGRSLFQSQDYYTMIAGLKKVIRSYAMS